MRSRSALFLPVAALIACSSTSAAPSTPSDAAPEADETTVSCAQDPMAESYAAGMVHEGTQHLVRFTLISADPPPPTRGTTRWILRLADLAGAPISDATFPPMTDWGTWPVGVRPFMPHHGHPATVTPSVTSNGDGTYVIDDLTLFMPGLWEVTIRAQSGAGIDDTTFGFCIEG